MGKLVTRCPNGEPHYWFIDSELHGVCRKCGAKRDFPYRPSKYESWQGKGFIPTYRDKAKPVR